VNTVPTAVGLVLALLGPPAVALAFRGVGGLAGNAAAQACLLLLTLAVALIVRRGEHRSLASAGVRAPRAGSFVWAALLAAAYMFVVAPLMVATLRWSGARGFEPTLHELALLPAWYRVVIVVIGGTIEEFLYRGYAFERLALLLRSQTGALVLSSLIFAYAHTPLWGLGVSTALVLPAIFSTAFYLWRRDLAANVMAHVVTDLAGIVLA
jgi:uncharacterized protein